MRAVDAAREDEPMVAQAEEGAPILGYLGSLEVRVSLDLNISIKIVKIL